MGVEGTKKPVTGTGNTGPSTLKMIEDNITSMAEIARANHIQPILGSVLQADHNFLEAPGPAR